MLNAKLFNMYHSFLLKKWYLMLYTLLLLLMLVGGMIFLSMMNQQEPLRIGLVDKDQSSETELILKAVGDGQSIGKDLKIKQYQEADAKRLLKQHHLNGYFVFDKGMTDAFYHNGQLPITVYTYDKDSIESVIIKQLTLSVYDRLMLSEGGALTYSKLFPEASEEELLNMLTDMLFTGLNRDGVFDDTALKIYDTKSYYLVSAYFIAIFLCFLSLFTILKMNQFGALKQRLMMLHFSMERLTIIRGIITAFYTACFACVGWLLITSVLPMEFKSYNWLTAVTILGCYIVLLLCLFVMTDLLVGMWKYILLTVVIVLILCSGAIIPSIYLKHGFFSFVQYSPFTIIMNQLLELLLNNYIIVLQPLYIATAVMMCATIIFLVWRYRR